MDTGKFVITKRIAKHGKQGIIVIPKILQEELKPDTVVKLTIEVIKRGDQPSSNQYTIKDNKRIMTGGIIENE